MSITKDDPATDKLYALFAFAVFVKVIYGLAVFITKLLSVSSPESLDVNFATYDSVELLILTPPDKEFKFITPLLDSIFDEFPIRIYFLVAEVVKAMF